eukprot:m.762182 g.762182  ORF g.762182 m.762182 type:complete len:634 (-) comp23208_c1_seq40:1346-3247(-)
MLSICPRIFEMFSSSKLAMPSTSATSPTPSPTCPTSPMKKTSTRLAEQQLLRDVRSQIRKRKNVTDNYIVYEAYKPHTGDGAQEKKITRFTTGMKIEAVDCTSCWYRAEILNVKRDKREVLVHFDGYDTRFDQVMSFDSPLIRPAGRLEALARTLRKSDRGRDAVRKPKRGPRGTSPPWRLVGMDVEPGSKRVRKVTRHYDGSVQRQPDADDDAQSSEIKTVARPTVAVGLIRSAKKVCHIRGSVQVQNHARQKEKAQRTTKVCSATQNAQAPKKSAGGEMVKRPTAVSPRASAPRKHGNVMQSVLTLKTPEAQSPESTVRRRVCGCKEASAARLSSELCAKCKNTSLKKHVLCRVPGATAKGHPKPTVHVGKCSQKRKQSAERRVAGGRSRSGPILAVMNLNSADVKVRRLSEGAEPAQSSSSAIAGDDKMPSSRNLSLGSSEGFMFDRSFAPSKIETLTVKQIVTPAFKVVETAKPASATLPARLCFADVKIEQMDESDDDDSVESILRGDTRTPEMEIGNTAVNSSLQACAGQGEDLTDAAYLFRHRPLEYLERDRSWITPADASEPHANPVPPAVPPTQQHNSSASVCPKGSTKHGTRHAYQQQRGSSCACAELRWAGVAPFAPRKFSS